MTNLEYLKTTTNDDDFTSELYSVIHKKELHIVILICGFNKVRL